MTDTVFDALRAAINIARDEQIQTIAQLRYRLNGAGHAKEDVDTALRYWAAHNHWGQHPEHP